MVASQRNQALQELADTVRGNRALLEALRQAAAREWEAARPAILSKPAGEAFVQSLERLQREFMDVAFGGERLSNRPDLLIKTVVEMARSGAVAPSRGAIAKSDTGTIQSLESRFFEAAGPEREEEAREVLAIGRLSWRLRDDDNVLVGRLESQLLRALELAASRLPAEGPVSLAVAPMLAEALRDPPTGPVILPLPKALPPASQGSEGESPRQLIGQPGAPGLATGRVRIVRAAQDLGRFRAGEVLVCDAIQPTMTHLVPLACAIVERRGGMLIHGAIIARELGIPCVNGIADAVELLGEGEIVTVDGYLGIVTVGTPELDLEQLG
jgi:pyruvate,water dikinase